MLENYRHVSIVYFNFEKGQRNRQNSFEIKIPLNLYLKVDLLISTKSQNNLMNCYKSVAFQSKYKSLWQVRIIIVSTTVSPSPHGQNFITTTRHLAAKGGPDSVSLRWLGNHSQNDLLRPPLSLYIYKLV